MESKNKKQIAVEMTQPVYMKEGSAFVCQDKNNDSTVTVKLLAKHSTDEETPTMFTVTKTVSRNGQYGMHFKQLLNLDVDDSPTEGSKNLLVSGTIYDIITDLQNQIQELKERIK